MFIVDPETRGKVIAALNANGGNASPVHFTFKGGSMADRAMQLIEADFESRNSRYSNTVD